MTTDAHDASRAWGALRRKLCEALEVAFDRVLEAGWLPDDLEIVHDDTRGICMQLAIVKGRYMMMTVPGSTSRCPMALSTRLVVFETIATFDYGRIEGPVCWINEHWVRELPVPDRIRA